MCELESLKKRAEDMRKEGMTCAEVAQMLGVSKSWVHKWTLRSGRNYRRWTEEERNKATDRYLKGKTCKQIAKAMGRTEQSIRLCVWREIKTRRKRGNTPQAKEVALWLCRAIRLGATPGQAMTAVRKACVMGRSTLCQ